MSVELTKEKVLELTEVNKFVSIQTTDRGGECSYFIGTSDDREALIKTLEKNAHKINYVGSTTYDHSNVFYKALLNDAFHKQEVVAKELEDCKSGDILKEVSLIRKFSMLSIFINMMVEQISLLATQGDKDIAQDFELFKMCKAVQLSDSFANVVASALDL